MDQWEYRVVSVDTWKPGEQAPFERTLNTLGSEGWEAVNVTFRATQRNGYTVLLKRRVG